MATVDLWERVGRLLVFTSKRHREEWDSGRLAVSLLPPLYRLVSLRKELLGVPTRATSIFRSFLENKALGGGSLCHVEWRAIDLAADSRELAVEIRVRVVVNTEFPVDVKAMQRIPPLDHGTGLHFHVQVSRNEARRPG